MKRFCQTMSWIETALWSCEDFQIDDLFVFLDSGHVISRCVDDEDEIDEMELIFVKNSDCDHDFNFDDRVPFRH